MKITGQSGYGLDYFSKFSSTLNTKGGRVWAYLAAELGKNEELLKELYKSKISSDIIQNCLYIALDKNNGALAQPLAELLVKNNDTAATRRILLDALVLNNIENKYIKIIELCKTN